MTSDFVAFIGIQILEYIVYLLLHALLCYAMIWASFSRDEWESGCDTDEWKEMANRKIAFVYQWKFQIPLCLLLLLFCDRTFAHFFPLYA